MYQIAIKHLKKTDKILAQIINQIGPCNFELSPVNTHFEALVHSIIFQQLSGKAANSIYRRFQELYGGRIPSPSELLDTTNQELRDVGISKQKLSYLKDLAYKIESQELQIDSLSDLSDESIMEALIKVKGIGKWTVQMFLIFRLGRPNVLPELDLGIQKAIQLAYNLDNLPTPKQVLEIGAKWQPYCTTASRYLWRYIDELKPR